MLSFNEAYKAWRNRARGYSAASIVAKTLELLHLPVEDRLQHLKKVPWQLVLMVKWVCQDKMVLPRQGRRISQEQFDDLRQRLWDLPSICELGVRDSLPGQLFMRQLLRPQIEFQKRATPGVLREAALLASQPENSKLRRQFVAKTGLEIGQFMVLAYATYSEVSNGIRAFHPDSFAHLRERLSPVAVDAFLRNVALDFDELIAMFRALPDAREKFSSEYFEASPLRRFPLIKVNDDYLVWEPTILYRGLEGFVHSVLAAGGEDYMDDFSRLFERHVLLEARKVTPSFFYEDVIKTWLPKDSKVPDGLMRYPGCNVFVEAKSGVFDETVMTVGHSEALRNRTSAIRKAIRQGRSASDGVRTSGLAPQEVRDANEHYLLIVTNKELGLGTGARLATMYPPNTFPVYEEGGLLPSEHIYILSIEDFERLVSASDAGHVDIPAFLAECVALDRDPATSRFFLEQHLDRIDAPMRFSTLVMDAERQITNQ